MVSCSDDEVDYVPLAQQKYQAFDKMFTELANQHSGIDPNHTWGFGEEGDARTRSIIKENHELPEGLEKPTLASGEAEYVTKWFQENAGENSESLDISAYFIVYVSGNTSVDVWHHQWDGNYYNNNKNNGATSNFYDTYSTQNVVLDYLHINGEHMNDWNANGGVTLYVYDSNVSDIWAHNSYSDTNTTKWKLAKITYNGEEGYYVGLSAYSKKYIGTYETLPESGVEEDRADYTDYNREDYYDDWIFKIVPADGSTTDKETSDSESETIKTGENTYEYHDVVDYGRIFCEDLASSKIEDLDYNDVVFDYVIWHDYKRYRHFTNGVEDTNMGYVYDEGYSAQIYLLAAGGTLPLTVQGVDVHNAFDNAADVTMINTRDDNSTAYGSYATASPRYLTPVNYSGAAEDYRFQNISNANQIEIAVNYNNIQSNYLTAKRGSAPHKIRVAIGTPWMSERHNIADGFPSFWDWVGNESGYPTWYDNHGSDHYAYTSSMPIPSSKQPVLLSSNESTTVTTTTTTTKETELWSGTLAFNGLGNDPKNSEEYYKGSSGYFEMSSKDFKNGDEIRFYGEINDSNDSNPCLKIVGNNDWDNPLSFVEPVSFNSEGYFSLTASGAWTSLNDAWLNFWGRSVTLTKVVRLRTTTETTTETY